MTQHPPTWWSSLYDDLLSRLLMEGQTPQDLERDVDAIADLLELPPGGRVFDQCCGYGRLSLPLAARGYEVLGVDQAEVYVDRAARAARASGLTRAHFEVADGFTYVPESPCDAVLNWWTSFGYAVTDAGNQAMLQRAFEALRPGGTLLLDTFNLPGVLRHFRPEMVNRALDDEGREVVLLRSSQMDLDRGRLEKQWTYFMPDGTRRERASSVRLYMPHQLSEMVHACGFTQVRLLGDVAGEPLGLDHLRCILFARRPQ